MTRLRRLLVSKDFFIRVVFFYSGVLIIRVVTLAPSLNPTQGWSTVPANVLPRLADEHEVTALVGEQTDSKFSARYNFEVRNVLPRPIEMYHPVRLLQQTPRLRAEFREADLVHSFISYPYLPAAAFSLLGRDVPLTGTALGTYAVQPLQSFWSRRFLSFGYKRSETIFCISDYTDRRVTDELGLSNTTLLPLGIDLDRFGTDSPNDENYILSVGAVKERKGQDVLLKAFGEISDEYQDIDLVFAGPVHSEDYREALNRIVAEYGIEDRVKFMGNVDDRKQLANLYRDCTLFSLTPRVVDDNFEGFGLVYLEAAAYGKPAVATRSGGVPTAVMDGETGVLAPEDDVSGVASALCELLDEERRELLGENARRHAESLTWRAYTDELVCEWHNLINQQ